MSDVDRLLAAFSSGSLLRPSPDVPNIVDLARALARMAGADGIGPDPGSEALAYLIGPSEHLVFVLVDGLGMDFIEELPADSFLATHLVTELKTVFPSTTAVALTSIATGEWPSKHAVTGWWTHLAETGSAAVVLKFVTRSGQSLAEHGVAAGQAFPLPSLMAGMRRDTLALFPASIVDSVYSVYASGNRARRGYRSFREAVDVLFTRARDAHSPTYTYLYIDRIDGVVHAHGTRHPEVKAALRNLDRALERLWQGLGGRARIVLTGDHGFLDVPGPLRHQIRPSHPLMASLRFPPSGDTRVMFLHTRDGAEERVRRHFRQRFGDRFLLITIEDAEALELFGPGALSPTTKERLGDLMALSNGPGVIEYHGTEGASRILSQAAQHSGLTPQEMRVPLVVA